MALEQGCYLYFLILKKEKLREMAREREIMETRGMIVVIKRLDFCKEIFSFVFCQNTCMTIMVFFPSNL